MSVWCRGVGMDPWKIESIQGPQPQGTTTSQFRIKEPTSLFPSKSTNFQIKIAQHHLIDDCDDE